MRTTREGTCRQDDRFSTRSGAVSRVADVIRTAYTRPSSVSLNGSGTDSHDRLVIHDHGRQWSSWQPPSTAITVRNLATLYAKSGNYAARSILRRTDPGGPGNCAWPGCPGWVRMGRRTRPDDRRLAAKRSVTTSANCECALPQRPHWTNGSGRRPRPRARRRTSWCQPRRPAPVRRRCRGLAIHRNI